MKLYYAPGTCAVAVWIALDWVGADYEVERVVLGSDEYRKINPLGAVPALETDDGQIMTQAGAILAYIADKYPDAKLGPDDSPEDRYLFNQIIAFITGDYHPGFWPIFGPEDFTTSRDEKELDNVIEAAYKNLDGLASLLDKNLEGKEYIYKDKKTVLDPYAYILSRWLANTPKSWKEYPNLSKYMQKWEKDERIQEIIHESVKELDD